MDTPPPPPPPYLAPAPAPKKRNTTLIVVLCIVGFLFLFIGGCFAACVWGVNKAKQYSESAQKNPQYAAVSILASINPEIQIVSKDEASGKITVRNKKSGEVVTIDTTAYSTENITKALEDFARGMKLPPPDAASNSEGTSSTRELKKTPSSDAAGSANAGGTKSAATPARASALAGVLKKFPDYVPSYPSSITTEATLNALAGSTMGTYAFQTSDSPDAVIEFYEKRITGSGKFSVANKSSATNDHGPTAQLTATRSDPAGTFAVAAESQQRGTQVVVTFSQH